MLDQFIWRINTYIVNPVIGFMFALALAYFVWGLVEFYLYKDSDTEREAGKKHILWGLVGMLIMVGFYGIMQVIAGTFGLSVTRP